MFKRILPALIAVLLSSPAHAGEKEELLKLKNTTLNLIDALVKEGILSPERADALVESAEQSAAAELQQVERQEAEPSPGVVRVPYVPDFVREEIREQVRAELREDVVQDVLAQAKQERWGIPDVMPAWTERFKLKGDIRLRAQSDLFGADNQDLSYFDWQRINEKGGISNASEDAFLNTTDDRQRLRARLRLGVDAKISNDLKASMRITTGNENDPVSTNQTLGNYQNRYQLVLDRAFLKYDYTNLDGYNAMTLTGGRIPNPWFSSDLVWDTDLGFEGLAATFHHNLSGGDDLFEQDEQDRSLFLTLGAFPLQEENRYDDKWLFGAQLGTELGFDNQSKLTLGVAYYDYYNVEAQPNELGLTNNDWTAPDYMQKGNSLVRISNDIGETAADPRRVGLASDFNIVALTAEYRLARFAPTHVVLAAEFAKNIGFDRAEILQRTGVDIEERNEAYGLELQVGWPEMRKRRDWQVFAGWKHIERDAVLDAFTDSDFHLGGTDAEGWIIGGRYGLAEDTWMSLRWLSADEIDGPPLGIDVLQLDLNARF